MAYPDHVPELVIGPLALTFLNSCDWNERRVLYQRIFSLLLNPDVDHISKFDLNYFPYTGMNVRSLSDDIYFITYSLRANRDVHILTINRWADLG